MCDFNSHNEAWDYANTNCGTEVVEKRADNNELYVIHDQKLLHYFNSSRQKRGYYPDILLVII